MTYPSLHPPGDPTKTLIQNVTEDEHCRFCCPHLGMVVSINRDEYVYAQQEKVGSTGKPFKVWAKTHEKYPGRIEEYGPCPMCEAGRQIEFPSGEDAGPWGKEGYWRGMNPQMKPTCDCGVQPAQSPENASRLRDMVGTLVDGIDAARTAEEERAEESRTDEVRDQIRDSFSEPPEQEIEPESLPEPETEKPTNLL